jgi:hypothetical protein
MTSDPEILEEGPSRRRGGRKSETKRGIPANLVVAVVLVAVVGISIARDKALLDMLLIPLSVVGSVGLVMAVAIFFALRSHKRKLDARMEEATRDDVR